jgi:hypothetical protein
VSPELILVVACLAAPESAAAQLPVSGKSPLDLLERAHAFVQRLDPNQAAFILSRLVPLASRTNNIAAKTWAGELMDSAPLLDDQECQIWQSSVIQAIADVDPDVALDMLKRMAPPAPASAARDLRTVVAVRVFWTLWQRHGNRQRLARLQEDATDIARGGHYPYEAFASIVNSLSTHDSDLALDLFRNVVDLFSVAATDADLQECLRFVEDARSSLPKSEVERAVDILIDDVGRIPSRNEHGRRNRIVRDAGQLMHQLEPGWSPSAEQNWNPMVFTNVPPAPISDTHSEPRECFLLEPNSQRSEVERLINPRRSDAVVDSARDLVLALNASESARQSGRHQDSLAAADEGIDAGLTVVSECLRAAPNLAEYNVGALPAIYELVKIRAAQDMSATLQKIMYIPDPFLQAYMMTAAADVGLAQAHQTDQQPEK